MNMRYFIVLILIICIFISGCSDTNVNKAKLSQEYINYVMNKTVPIWNSTHNNSTIITSSAYAISARQVNGSVNTTILFNTSDGRVHSVNVSDYLNSTQILDIDGQKIAM